MVKMEPIFEVGGINIMKTIKQAALEAIELCKKKL